MDDLMKKMNMYDFVCHDAALYLDTHPSDTLALEYFERYKKLAAEARNEYVKQHGAINHATAGEKDGKWNWIDGKWPWEV